MKIISGLLEIIIFLPCAGLVMIMGNLIKQVINNIRELINGK
jgi:phosphotransferase system  glucose/maltose/N-acetylglucosamine-specific IIC component